MIIPGIDAKAMLTALPSILARWSADPKAASTVSAWRTVGDLLVWYTDRMSRDRDLSAKRKASAQSALRCHLVPRLADIALSDFDRPSLDRLLMWPMQELFALSFVRSVYGVLAVAFRQAARLALLDVNPMADLKFTDFVRTRIRPKPARWHEADTGRSDDCFGPLSEAVQKSAKSLNLALTSAGCDFQIVEIFADGCQLSGALTKFSHCFVALRRNLSVYLGQAEDVFAGFTQLQGQFLHLVFVTRRK